LRAVQPRLAKVLGPLPRGFFCSVRAGQCADLHRIRVASGAAGPEPQRRQPWLPAPPPPISSLNMKNWLRLRVRMRVSSGCHQLKQSPNGPNLMIKAMLPERERFADAELSGVDCDRFFCPFYGLCCPPHHRGDGPRDLAPWRAEPLLRGWMRPSKRARSHYTHNSLWAASFDVQRVRGKLVRGGSSRPSSRSIIPQRETKAQDPKHQPDQQMHC